MVGVGKGGKDSILARVAVTDRSGKALMDLYVAPTEDVTDYRTFVTGIKGHHLKGGKQLAVIWEVNAHTHVCFF